ncbi:MAG: quinone-interacting membrane-bound oxidoreductase complex subunit QmoC [Thermoleophilia bacterium]
MADETVDKTEETAGAGDETVVESDGEDAAVSTEDAPAVGESSEAPGGEAVGVTEPPTEAAQVAREAVMIKPDVGFVKDIIKGGGSDVKKCYQCATCSVACNLTPDDNPFPRKEMMWAQWGLKDKLMGNPDIWLCHQCNDCTAQCPRGAKPGTIMQAIAKMTISSFSPPSFLTKAVGSPSAFVLMAAIPVIILLLVIGLSGEGDFSPARGEIVNSELHHAGKIVYASFISHAAIDFVFSAFFTLSIIIFALGIRNYWGALKSHAISEGIELKGGGLSKLGPVLSEIAAHKRFGKCDETEDRKISHLLIFYAFGLLFLATATSVLFTYGPRLWGADGVLSPYDQISVVKLFGNIGAVAGIFGIGLITVNRFKHQEKTGVGSYFDWMLIGIILIIMVTGILSEVFRLIDAGMAAYPTYFIHLSAVLFLFMYAPFSKMAHMVYRTVALVFARVTERDMGVE